MKINSRNLILMALIGMSSVHLMASKGGGKAPAKSNSSVTPTATPTSGTGRTMSQRAATAAQAVYNAPGQVAKSMGHSSGNFISGQTGSLASATGYNPNAGKALPSAGVNSASNGVTGSVQQGWNFTTAGTAAAKGLQSAGTAVYNAPGYAVARLSGSNSGQPTQFITGSTGSLASATGYKTAANQNGSWSLGNNAVVNAPGKALGGRFGLNAEGQILSGQSGSLASATGYQTAANTKGSWNFTKAGQTAAQGLQTAGTAVYKAPGQALGGRFGLNAEGQIISGETGSVMSAATAAKTAITQTLSSIGATMTPSLGQINAVKAVYRDAMVKVNSTASWTAERFNKFTRSVSEQVSRIFETSAAREVRLKNENAAWKSAETDFSYNPIQEKNAVRDNLLDFSGSYYSNPSGQVSASSPYYINL